MALQPSLVIQRLSITPPGHTSPNPFLFPRPISSSDHLLISITRAALLLLPGLRSEHLLSGLRAPARLLVSSQVDLVGGGL